MDGRFLASRSTGVDRYAYEILKELDRLCADLDIALLVPAGVEELPRYQNIRVIQSHFSNLWTQGIFAVHTRLRRAVPINLCNEVSLLAPKGIAALHDVCYAEENDFFPAEERSWFLKAYGRIKRHTRKIITVSEFSKQRITALLGIRPEQIAVIGNGWQHFASVSADEAVFERFPQVMRGQYYFTMSSANRNKNVDWVIENAKHFPGNCYVIGGKGLDRIFDFSRLKNVVYLGYLKDEEAKALMKYCRAFVFPSFYEGFGIPPLEAASAGAPVVVSGAASLPEIFGESAHYIDPCDAGTDLNALLEEPVKTVQPVLLRYSWEKSAGQLYKLLKEERG